jgi:glycosyltransferase involved in cell wall biosynthesis
VNKLITFIIPAYNAEETIVAALDSFSFQYSNFFNILIIDDGSKKPLRPYVERYLKEYKNIKLIRQKNLNWGGAINNSFKYINSKYIKILDADDQLIKESFKPYLDELLELSKKNIDVILTSIDIHKIKSDKSHIHSINLKDKVMIFNDNKVFHSSKLITHHYLTLKTVLLKSFIPLLTKQAYTDNLFMYQV